MSDLLYEPDLELAEAFHNLFFEIILPALIIVGHFLTITKNRAIVVNNYKYRFLEEPKKKDKRKKKDLKISEAKVIYLESNRGFAAVEALLEKYRDLCPKPLFSSH